MKVSSQLYNLSEQILDNFDPARIKQNEIKSVGEVKDTGNKWTNLEKQMDKEDKIQEIQDKDFDKETKEKYHKMMGCSKDHAAEIDIYNKTYAEKIQRIKLMKE